mgnify:CR=1 FL=1|tara:strand:- start:1396 stop:1566 length:171 start_codon:yes stop_codon:yes gene_type:complete
MSANSNKSNTEKAQDALIAKLKKNGYGSRMVGVEADKKPEVWNLKVGIDAGKKPKV